MRSRVQQWGNSLAVRIPKPFAEEAGLRRNADVEISVRNGAVVINRVVEEEYSLEELVSRITPGNRHEESDFGPSVGNEAWP